MEVPGSHAFEIEHPSDVGAARRAVRTAALQLGFEPQACEEIALAMTELATNLLKHARHGRLGFQPLTRSGRVGLEIESSDQGPGIPNIERALADGYSGAGTRGTGLGAVNRLMDELELVSNPRGTRIVCRKWRRVPQPTRGPSPLVFGVATRPCPGCESNGDAFILRQWDQSALAGVIDGLGHGPMAHRAAETARHYLETHYDLALGELFAGVDRACRATRGVVMALARFDWGRGRLNFASVGDIEARAFPREPRFPGPVQRGILGLNARAARVTEHDWSGPRVLVLHSDGLGTHWSWKRFPGLVDQPAPAIARQLLKALAKEQDDATVLVAQQTAA